MAKSASHQPNIADLTVASRSDLEALVNRLVETGRVSADEINDALTNIREVTGERAKAASETGESQQVKPEKALSPEQKEALLATVKARFVKNIKRHEGIEWSKVQAKLEANPEKMWALNEMERTEGEPDVVGYDKETNEYIFFDCSAESPEGRRNIVYDKEAEDYLAAPYPNEKCNRNAVDMAASMGIEILDEAQYENTLQKLGKFDLNTWSLLKTPYDIRKTGGALVGLRYGDHVRVSRDGAYNHSAFRAFRGSLRV
jgi:hypothetical protein